MPPKAGPGRPAIGALTSVRLTDELREGLDAYTTRHDLAMGEAIRALLTDALAAAEARDSIWSLFPELDPVTTSNTALADAVEFAAHNEPALPTTDVGEYDWDGHCFTHGVMKIRGRWIYYRETRLAETDDNGHHYWHHDYTLTATKNEAENLYRAALLEHTTAWRAEAGKAMWAECGYDGDIAQQLCEAGELPKAAFDDDLAAALADQLADNDH